MARPTKVKVGWHTFQIRWLTRQQWALEKHDQDSAGSTYISRSLIVLCTHDDDDNKIDEQLLREVLMHEILHAVWHVSALAYDTVSRDHEDLEEYTLRFISGVILQVLKDNPPVLKYLLEA